MKSLDETKSFVNQYMALWNETDATVRHRMMSAVWSEDAIDYIASPEVNFRGLSKIEARIQRANKQFVEDGGFIFRPRDNATYNHNAVRFNWEMISVTGGVVSVGFEFLILDQENHITQAYQFIES